MVKFHLIILFFILFYLSYYVLFHEIRKQEEGNNNISVRFGGKMTIKDVNPSNNVWYELEIWIWTF